MELKEIMTFDEMAIHFAENNKVFKPNRVTVGKHAKANGYKLFRQMISGVNHWFYVKQEICEK